MAVALATLPLNRRLAGAGDAFLATATGAGGAGDFAACLAGALAGLLAGAFLAAALVTGFEAGFAPAVCAALVFLETAFFGAALDAAGLLEGAFPGDDFLGTGFFFGATAFFATTGFFDTATFFATAAFFGATFLATDFFATVFLGGLDLLACGFAAGLDTVGFAFDFTATAGLEDFLAAGFGLAADLVTLRPAFTGVLLAFFTAFPFAAVAFDATVLTTFTLLEAWSLCALALELRVVFAISLHRGWPWRPGVIAHVSFTSKPGSGILVTLHPPTPFRQRESSDSIDTVVAQFVQALDQSIAWTPVPLLPELLRLCTDCRDSLWPLARQPARRLAFAALSAPV